MHFDHCAFFFLIIFPLMLASIFMFVVNWYVSCVLSCFSVDVCSVGLDFFFFFGMISFLFLG